MTIDKTQIVVNVFWLGMAISVGITIAILQYFDRRLMSDTKSALVRGYFLKLQPLQNKRLGNRTNLLLYPDLV